MTSVSLTLALWQQELLDLSNRNRLLNFRPSTTRPSTIALVAPTTDEIYRALLEGASLAITGRDDEEDEAESDADAADDDLLTPHTPDDLTLGTAGSAPGSGIVVSNLSIERTNRVALRLLANARSAEQEQGVNVLFAAFGLLKWRERTSEETFRYAPLVLVPVKIEEKTREGRFVIRAAGEDPEFNQTLTERLRRDFGLNVGVDIDEEMPLADVYAQVLDQVRPQAGWDVLDQSHVGLFQFHKLRMFKDLSEHATIAAEHAIVQALALEGVTIGSMPDGVPREEDLDRVVTPDRAFTVLDADASQLMAIQAIVRGANLIIQGPPGTGKSQTIANVIAECIAAGKSVLFVSEKAAAIEVVHQRLTRRGLGDFCLMLHSQKATKRDVIAALGARLEPVAARPANAEEGLHLKRLATTRATLNSYAHALHVTRAPLGQSVFWAHAELSRLHDAPFLDVPPPSLGDVSLELMEQWGQAVNAVARHDAVLREGPSHPWADIQVSDLTLAERLALRQSLDELLRASGDAISLGRLIAGHLGISAPTTVTAARTLLAVTRAIPSEGSLQPAWLDRAQNTRLRAIVDEATTRANNAASIATDLAATYADSILDVDADEAIAEYQRGWFSRLLSSSYRSHRARLREATRDARQRDRAAELGTLRAVRELNEQAAWFRANQEPLTVALGLSLDPRSLIDPVTVSRCAAAVSASANILDILSVDLVPPAFAEAVGRPNPGIAIAGLQERLGYALASVEAALTRLVPFFGGQGPCIDGVPLADRPVTAVHDWINLRLTRFDDVDSWLRAQAALRDARAAELGGVVQTLLDRRVSPGLWNGALRKLVLTHWLDSVYRQEPVLKSFRGEEHEQLVEQFRALDRASVDTSVHRVRRALAARQGQVSASYGGEPAFLRREYAKRKRHVPLRRLFEHIPNLLPTLKPCLMMSPLSVAQFLPADRYRFDVVIFDEASQVRPHDAIGAIMRGRQLVVAGDEHQLPPTTFFDRQFGDEPIDEDDPQDLRDLESVLKLLQSRGMPSTELLWHYRSRHEDLIAFSNHHVYGRRLVTFPSPSSERSDTQGVRLEHVADGRYQERAGRSRDSGVGSRRASTRVNQTEAQRVAALVIQHARQTPESSLGVVALNMNQKEAIEDEVRALRQLDQSLDEFFAPEREEAFFVKALEQVQGDERDVIVISIGYGKNAQGVLSHNFGPINKEEGYRRLNVLVTRAKHQIIVVSSIRAGDLDDAKVTRLGPRLLKNYLDFAERGAVALAAESTGGDGEAESPFEIEVGEALRRAGYDVRRQVGTSGFRIDLAVIDPRQPGRYLLGIECDGATYHSSKTARDRDRLRQELLEGLGWTIHRIWSTDWVRQRDRELSRVIASIEDLLQRPVPTVIQRSPAPPAENPEGLLSNESAEAPAPSNPPDASPIAVPYVTADLRRFSTADILATSVARVADAVVACVGIEGPVHREVLTRRITAAWGYQRAGTRIAQHIATATDAAVRQGNVLRRGEFLWPTAPVEIAVRGPGTDGAVRDVAHVPEEEIVAAFLALLLRAFSLTEDELVQQAARVFGYNRTGADISRRFKQVLGAAVQQGSIRLIDGRCQLTR